MKWMIASDIHGSASYCRQMLDRFDEEQADRLLLLGDLLYHGPRNALPDEYDPKAVIDMLNARAEVLLCVRGNCEAEVDQMVLSFPVMADYALLPVGKKLIYITHGHHAREDNPPPLRAGIFCCMDTRMYRPAPLMRISCTSIRVPFPFQKRTALAAIWSLRRTCFSGRGWKTQLCTKSMSGADLPVPYSRIIGKDGRQWKEIMK